MIELSKRLRELGEKATAAKWTVIGKVEFDREPMVVISIQTPRGLLTLSANGLPAKGEMRAIAELICLMRNNLKQFLDAAERVERQWISVEERLPQIGVSVLVVWSGCVQRQTAHLEWKPGTFMPKESDPKLWYWAEEDADPCPFEEITHWMPLPAAPPVAEGE